MLRLPNNQTLNGVTLLTYHLHQKGEREVPRCSRGVGKTQSHTLLAGWHNGAVCVEDGLVTAAKIENDQRL